MRSMSKGISKYTPFLKSTIQARMSYKFDFFMRIFGGLIQLMILYYLWMAIFNSSKTGVIEGFSSAEMIVYIIMTFITSQIINISIEWEIAEDIDRGDIAINLIKPISYEKKILAQSLGNVLINLVTISLPIWIIFYGYKVIKLGEELPNIENILLFILSLILGYLVMFLFNFIFAISAFFVTYIWGFMMCKEVIITFLSGQLIPIVFFPEVLQNILKYLPFSAMNYTPVMIYMGKMSTDEMFFNIGIQCIWLVILLITFRVLWSKAMKRVTVVGG